MTKPVRKNLPRETLEHVCAVRKPLPIDGGQKRTDKSLLSPHICLKKYTERQKQNKNPGRTPTRTFPEAASGWGVMDGALGLFVYVFPVSCIAWTLAEREKYPRMEELFPHDSLSN